jgi:hypothetical protein
VDILGYSVDAVKMNDLEANIRSRLGRIAENLRRLRDKDSSFAVFGAQAHQYRLGPALTESEVERIEERLGIELPIEYRLFVTQLGNGGAGPHYGLFAFDGCDPEDITSLEQVRKHFRWTHAFDPGSWESPSGDDVWWDEDSVGDGERPTILNLPGVLYICHYGCALRFFLIVQGESVGEVWMDKQPDHDGVVPECDEDGRHLSFLDWYEKWLDKAPKQIPIAKIGRPRNLT